MAGQNSQVHFRSLDELAEFIAALEEARSSSHFVVRKEINPDGPDQMIWVLTFSGGY